MNQVAPPNALYIESLSDMPDNKTIISKITSSSILTSLASPFRVIFRCHIFLIVYLALLMTALFWICSELDAFLISHIVSLGTDLNIKSSTLDIVSLIGSSIIWLTCLPVLIVAVSLPTEDLWLYQKMSLLRVLKQTPSNIFVTFQILVIGTRNVFYFLIPLFAITGGYWYAAKLGRIAQLPLVVHVLAAIIGLSVLWKTIPILLAPIVAVCGQYTTQGALAYAPSVVHKCWFNLTLIFLLGIAITIPSIYGIQQANLPQEYQPLAYLGAVAACLWYTLSAVTHELMLATGKIVFSNTEPQPL